MKILCFLLILSVTAINARLFEGQCRPLIAPVVDPFNYKLYLGKWYEILWYDDEYETFDECIVFTYDPTSTDAFDMTLDLQEANHDFAHQQYKGHGVLSNPGELSTTFGSGIPSRVNHYVLATDYEHYAFVWDCFNVNSTHYNERMWYFDREANPSQRPSEVENLLTYFDPQYIRTTYHGKECLY
ncbi:Apolipoprotein D [Pseudolycoriella hygida]|uniref:Apolipoprotein D n=1 Tax=Pseudolycoriella hygida TaxID=35572 RepID=A0A9Q0MMW9_9DIPT|nr:Apolipoprotein D [Pseudolycoriella hygida]KAJ6644229.1 Apolipoprotein D [Pseudolycoriella hygida]